MALGSAFGRFADGVGNNEGVGQAAKAGAITGGLTYGGGKALQGLRGALTGGGAASGGTVAQAGQPMGNAAASFPGGENVWGGAAAPTPAPFTPSSGGFLNKLGSGLGHAWEQNPGAVLQGAGTVANAFGGMGARNAESRQANAQADAMEFDNEQKKRREASLDPIRRALAGMSFQSHDTPYTPFNPYGARP